MKPCLVDVNVWLALAWAEHIHHRAAVHWLSILQAGEAIFCRPTQLGLLRLLTNRSVMGGDVISQAEAWKTYDVFMSDERIDYAREPYGVDVVFRRLSSTRAASTNTWNDAYLAAFAITAGYRLASFDGAFARYTGLDFVALR